MSAQNKAKGTRYENDIVEWIRDNAPSLRAERLARAGAKDEGDVAVTFPSGVLVVEAKNHRAFSIPDWIAQSVVEARNYIAKRSLNPSSVFPVVIFKRRNKSIGESFVTMELHMFVEMVEWMCGDAQD